MTREVEPFLSQADSDGFAVVRARQRTQVEKLTEAANGHVMCARLAAIKSGETVIYYSGLTPRQIVRPPSFSAAWDARDRAHLVQKRIDTRVGKTADGRTVVLGVFDYMAVGR